MYLVIYKKIIAMQLKRGADLGLPLKEQYIIPSIVGMVRQTRSCRTATHDLDESSHSESLQQPIWQDERI